MYLMSQSSHWIGFVVHLAMFIHPANILILLAQLFCQQTMPHAFPVVAHFWISGMNACVKICFKCCFDWIWNELIWTYIAIRSDSSLSECFVLWKLRWFRQLLILSKLRPTFDCNLSSSALRRERSHFFSNTTISFIVVWAVTIHIFTPLWYDDYSNYQ